MNKTANDRYLGMISLSQKAGKLVAGEGKVQDVIRSGKACLIILSEDASDNTAKKFTDMSRYRDIPIVYISDRYDFGRAIGRKYAVSAAVTDKGFADNIAKLYECGTQTEYAERNE